jgi:hypothetical protein
MSVPHVRLQHAGEIEHYVALPESSGENPLVWDLAYLLPTDTVPPVLPLQQRVQDPASSLIDMALTYRYYRAGQRDFTAKISALDKTAFVSCHDVTFFVKRNGFCFVVSVFDIQGNHSPYCDIAFPAEYRLIQMQRDDVFPFPEHLDDGTIRVELLPGIPVQRLTMLYYLQWDADGLTRTAENRLAGERPWPLSLVFPQILSLPVQKTLWEVWYEPLPTMDMQINTLVNVWHGHERFSSGHPMRTLSQNDAGNLRVRMELARMSRVLASMHLMSTPLQGKEKHPAWSRDWNAIRQRAARLLPEWNTDKVSWDQTFLHGKSVVPQNSDPFAPEWEAWEESRDIAWIDAWISRTKTPQAIYDELTSQYHILTGETSPSSSPGRRDFVVDAQAMRERYFPITHFRNESIGGYYLAGAASCGITDLTLFFHSQTALVPPGVYLHDILWGTVSLVLLVMAVHRNTRRLFRRFSVLLAVVLIVFCWLFVQPNILGWTVLFILLISAVRIQWNQMREATAAVIRNQS